MRKSVLFVFLTVFFLQISATVLAQVGSFSGFDLAKTIGFVVGDPNIQQTHPEWLQFPNVIYYLIFPFIAIVTVLYGVFSEIRIFRSSAVKGTLAVVIAGMSLPTGAMITTVYYLYTAGAWISIVMFGILFIVGAALWGAGRLVGLGMNMSDINKEIGALNKELAELDRKFAAGEMKQEDYLKQRMPLAKRKRQALARLGTIEEVGGTETK